MDNNFQITYQPVDDTTFSKIARRFDYDVKQPLDSVSLGVWAERNPYTIEKIIYSSINNESVPGFFAYPSAGKGSIFPAVLLVHGSNGFWGKNEDWVMDWIYVLTQAGYCVLAIDNFGFGERIRGEIEYDGSREPVENEMMVIQSIIDLRRGIDYIMSRKEAADGKIALLGGSRGGWLGAILSGLEKRLQAIALIVTAVSDGDPRDSDIMFKHSVNYAPRITAPLLMETALHDKPARVEYSKILFPLITARKSHIWLDRPHYVPPRECNTEVIEWFDSIMK